eukprot:scaffold98_cov307-Prasinococcus_capsulatus_cf.AAC.16
MRACKRAVPDQQAGHSRVYSVHVPWLTAAAGLCPVQSKREGAWECRTCSLCNLEWEVECAVCGTAAPRGEHVV